MTLARYFNDERVDLRRKPQQFRKTWKVAEMWDLHYEIARRIALSQTNVDIAKSLNISKQTVSNVRNSPIVKRHVAVVRGAMDADTIDLGRRIQRDAPIAYELLMEVIKGNGAGEGASIGLRAKVADKHMDRAGYSPVKKFEGAVAHLSAQDIERIKDRAKMAGVVKDVQSDE